MLPFLVAVAVAAPTAEMLDSGEVRGTAHVALAPDVLRAKLADPTWVSAMDDNGTQVTVTGHDGDCLTADYVSPSAVMTVRYTVKQCPTATGQLSTLVQSSDFSAYEAEWSVAADGAGSLVTYRLRLDSSLPVPGFVMRRSMVNGVQHMMDTLAAVK